MLSSFPKKFSLRQGHQTALVILRVSSPHYPPLGQLLLPSERPGEQLHSSATTHARAAAETKPQVDLSQIHP